MFVFVSLLNANAQQKGFVFENYTQGNGLPSNESYFVYCDSKNYLWIATDQGVVRYNGNKIERFDLPDNVVFKIREDHKGRIWFFSQSGKLAYFFNGVIYPYKYNDQIADSIKKILIVDAYVKSNDEIVIASSYKNYNILRSGVIESKVNWHDTLPESVNFQINKIGRNRYFTQQKNFYGINIDTVVITLETHEKTFKFLIPCKIDISNQYGCVTTDEKDFYFFTDNKLIKLQANGSFKVVQLPSRILCLYTGKDNTIWAGLLKKGVVILNTNLEIQQNISMLLNKSVSAITNDYEGGTWLSTLENGVYYMKNTHVYNLEGESNLTQRVSRLYNVKDSTLLFANTHGVFKLFKGSVFPFYLKTNEEINDLFIDNHMVFLAGKFKVFKTHFYTLCKIEKLNSSLSKKVAIIQSSKELAQVSKNKYAFLQGQTLAKLDFNSIAGNSAYQFYLPTKSNDLSFKPGMIFSDLKNQVWVGSLNKLYKTNPSLDSLTSLEKVPEYFKKGITEMRQMSNGFYAIGIHFGGIAIMKDSSIIGSIRETDGLLSNSIKYLLPLKDQLWAATVNGISVINFISYQPLKYTITNIGKNEGFYNIIVNQLIPFQDNILAATSNGIYAIENPAQFINRVPLTIPLFINSISYYKGDTTGVTSISVPYKNNRIVIKYSAICFNSPDEILYYYNLDSNDSSWHTITGNELLLENLSPGTYNLKLKAGIPNQHRISTIQELKIVIEKPWWQDNWFRLAAILIFSGFVFSFYKYRITKIKNGEKQKMIQHSKMKELEQTALRSQMNPHFIFNCLTSIQQLIVSGKATDANEHLVKFARLIRKTLEISSRPYIKISEEKEYLSEYLFLEQLRLPGQFEFNIDIADIIDVNKTEIPNMMIQPIVENCIRHGIKELENTKGMIQVVFKQQEKFIICTVTDNGVGRKRTDRYHINSLESQKSYGLEIARKRLELLNETGHQHLFIEVRDLTHADGSTAGTQVVIQLPFKITNL